jgi:hypothetical protein
MVVGYKGVRLNQSQAEEHDPTCDSLHLVKITLHYQVFDGWIAVI